MRIVLYPRRWLARCKNSSHNTSKILSGKWGFKSTSWNDVSFEAKDIIKKMLVLDPEKRFTIEQALCHDWMTMDIKRKASIKLTRAQKKMEENFSSKRFKRSVNKIIAINRLSNRLSFGSMDNGSFKDSGRSSFGNGSFKNNPAWANGTFRNGSFVLNKPPSFGEDESGRSGRSIEGSDSLEDSDSMAIVRKRSGEQGGTGTVLCALSCPTHSVTFSLSRCSWQGKIAENDERSARGHGAWVIKDVFNHRIGRLGERKTLKGIGCRLHGD